jgi:hypothetical protein
MATRLAPGIDGLIVEPDYDTYRDVFLTLLEEQIPEELGLWEVKNSQKDGRHLLIRGNGFESKIFVRSAHNDQYVKKIDGLTTIGWAGLDEPARMQCGESAFNKCLGRLRSKKMNLLGWKHNPLFIVGSPRGFNWLADKMGCTEDHPEHAYTIGYQPDSKNYPNTYIRACKTSDNADNLADNYEEIAKSSYSDALYAQEFLASLMSAQGMIFPEWSKSLHVIPHALAQELWDQRVKRPIGGADWGFTAPAANVVMGWTHDSELIVVDEWYKRGKQVHEQGWVMNMFNETWAKRTNAAGKKTIPWFGDPADPGKIELLRKGFEHRGSSMTIDIKAAKYTGSASQHTTRAVLKGWQARIDLLRSLMSPRRLVQHPNFPEAANPGCPRLLISDKCTNLIREIPAYRQAEQKDGQPDREGAVGDDHAIDSVAGAAFTTATTLDTRSFGRDNG